MVVLKLVWDLILRMVCLKGFDGLKCFVYYGVMWWKKCELGFLL